MVLDELQKAVESKGGSARSETVDELVLWCWSQELHHGVGERGNVCHVQIQQAFPESRIGRTVASRNVSIRPDIRQLKVASKDKPFRATPIFRSRSRAADSAHLPT